MTKFGRDPVVGDVVILGECSYEVFIKWCAKRGEDRYDANFRCLKEYSVTPKEDTRFLMCMREKNGSKYIHIAPRAGIDIGGMGEPEND